MKGVDIEGAHIVSEGAYFRFWISNNNSFPINVDEITGDDNAYLAGPLVVPPNSSIDYNVIAPQISGVYKQVTYKFFLVGDDNEPNTVNFTVLVLNSSFVQIFDLIFPILIVIVFVIIATVAIVILRRHMHRKRNSLSED
jgi:hypothetical protein